MTTSLITRTVVTIDGLAGSGKTAIAKALASRLGFAHLSSGMVYRALAALAANNHVKVDDQAALISLLGRSALQISDSSAESCIVLVGGCPINLDLYSTEVSRDASIVASLKGVRETLLPVQREAFPGRNLVAEGRDMGTVVFPSAANKYFLETPLEVRAERRLRQMQGADGRINNNEQRDLVLREMINRDRRDREREVSPTKPATDSVIIDNSDRALADVVEDLAGRVLATQ